jgi:hypothetical protein
VPTKKCDGTINGKPVKIIITDNGLKKAYFAKPKNYDVETPHFEQTSGSITVHEHSPDCRQFRVMTSSEIYSGSFTSGTTFASNNGKDMTVLPMKETTNGIALDFSSSGSYVTVTSGSQWVLMAFGNWGEWRDVQPKKDKTKFT